MNKSINIKMIISLFTIILIISMFCSPSSHAIGDMMSAGKEFLSVGNNVEDTINTTALKTTSDYIYNTLLAIAIIVAVIVAMVLGIQFMIASADEKAKVKEALMPFIAGCIVVFGAFTIWKVAVNIGNKAESKIKYNGEGWMTPPVSGYICDYCGEAIGDIPAGVIVGGRDYTCRNCGATVVEAGTITGATKSQ